MAILSSYSPAQWNAAQLFGTKGVRQRYGGGIVKGGTALANTPTSEIPTSVSQPFQQALASLSGTGSDVEQMYQTGKRRTLSDIAMQSVQSGMANTLNLPAAGMAYEQAVRPGTNVAVAGQRAGILTSLGQTAAGIYGTQVGAGTAAQQMGLQYASNQASLDLQRYLADLEAQLKRRELSIEERKLSQSSGILGPPQA